MFLYWSLPERCLYEILVFLRHSPTILSSLGLFSNYMCSVKRTFLLHKNCQKKIKLIKLGLVPLRCHLPILGELATSAREPFFAPSTLSCNFADLLSYPWAGFVLLGSTTEGATGIRECWYWSLIWNLILNMIRYLTWQRGNKKQGCLGIWGVVSGYQGCPTPPTPPVR